MISIDTIHRRYFRTLLIVMITVFPLYADVTSFEDVKIGFLFDRTEKTLHDDAETAVKLWVHSIAKSHNFTTYPIFFKDFASLLHALKQGDIGCIILSSKIYLDHADDIDPYILNGWTSSKTDAKTFRYYIVADDANGYLHERNIHISYADDELLAKEVARTYLPKVHQHIYKTTKSSSRALLNLFFGKTDIAIIPDRTWKTSVEMNPQLQKKLHVIYKTDPIFINSIFFYSKHLSPSLRKKFMHATEHLYSTKEGAQLSQLFKIKKIFPLTLNDLKALKLFYHHRSKL